MIIHNLPQTYRIIDWMTLMHIHSYNWTYKTMSKIVEAKRRNKTKRSQPMSIRNESATITMFKILNMPMHVGTTKQGMLHMTLWKIDEAWIIIKKENRTTDRTDTGQQWKDPRSCPTHPWTTTHANPNNVLWTTGNDWDIEHKNQSKTSRNRMSRTQSKQAQIVIKANQAHRDDITKVG